MKNIFPLADKLRPTSLDAFVGQDHLVGEGKMIRSFIENKKLSSLIFWGPPGDRKDHALPDHCEAGGLIFY